ncbi:MAG: hypothetical protein ACI9K3_000645 [Halovenus sp.]|mgnify:FL=1|jgi:hypothetical protein
MRAKVGTDTLLSVVFGLVVVWLVLAAVSRVVDLLVLTVAPFLLGLSVVVLILLWWFDYI